MQVATTHASHVKSHSSSKKQQNTVYKKTLSSVQNDMPSRNRIFSTFIHSKSVQLISNILGATIFRPNALFFAGFFAFCITTVAYIIAKNSGYELSGSETTLSLILGLLIGIAYDFMKTLFSGRHKE